MRILAFDTSLGRPGAAVVEVKRGQAKIVAFSHISTDTSSNYATRTKTIEAWAHLFIREHLGSGFDAVVREKLNHKVPKIQYAIFSAWNAIDRALNDFGLEVNEDIPQQTMKKHVVGKGKAEKAEVEEAVRKWTSYKGEFTTDDESDSTALCLAYLISKGVIKE